MLYEISNPSDPYTMDTDDREAACLACLMLGNGMYGLEGEDFRMPIFIFGGAGEWWAETFGYPLEEAAARVGKSRLAEALETVLIGSVETRRVLVDAMAAIDDPGKRQALRDKHHDRNRTSMNNIGKRAYQMAESLRKQG